MRKRPTLEDLEKRCAEWNAGHPIGSEVWYHPVIGEPQCARYHTTTTARVLSGHTCVVWLEGYRGCVALEALTDDPFVKREIR